MIGTLAFHLGPTTQMESLKNGYSQSIEDKLLAQSGWQDDGYRLFGISAFAGSSAGGWFELPAESNAVFLRAAHWRDLGGLDERFVSPGGGLVNLDLWSRICGDADGELILLLGEATFHQFHGGVATTTSGAASPLPRRIQSNPRRIVRSADAASALFRKLAGRDACHSQFSGSDVALAAGAEMSTSAVHGSGTVKAHRILPCYRLWRLSKQYGWMCRKQPSDV